MQPLPPHGSTPAVAVQPVVPGEYLDLALRGERPALGLAQDLRVGHLLNSDRIPQRPRTLSVIEPSLDLARPSSVSDSYRMVCLR